MQLELVVARHGLEKGKPLVVARTELCCTFGLGQSLSTLDTLFPTRDTGVLSAVLSAHPTGWPPEPAGWISHAEHGVCP
jgi:hypothetical protein